MRFNHLFPVVLAAMAAACTFRSTPRADEQVLAETDSSAAGTPAMASIQRAAADSGKALPATIMTSTPVDAGAAALSSTSAAPPVAATAAVSSKDSGMAAAVDPDAEDASAPQTTPAMQQQCDAELSKCLIADPLGYDVCLRKNAERGCPEPETSGTTTTPVLDENGNPISQVCQAELAKCIMRLPTPENAAECTETARKCK